MDLCCFVFLVCACVSDVFFLVHSLFIFNQRESQPSTRLEKMRIRSNTETPCIFASVLGGHMVPR